MIVDFSRQRIEVDPYVFTEIATPSTPPATKHKVYFKSDGKLYRLNSAGVEVEVGAGGGGGGEIVLHARNSAGQVLPALTYTDVVNYSTPLIDPFTAFNTTTGAYTVADSGNYYITGLCGIAVSTATQRLLSVRILANSGNIAQINREVTIPATFYGVTVSGVASLSSGQTIKLQAYSGISEPLIAADAANHLTIIKL